MSWIIYALPNELISDNNKSGAFLSIISLIQYFVADVRTIISNFFVLVLGQVTTNFSLVLNEMG